MQALNFTLKICVFLKKQLTTSTIYFNLLQVVKGEAQLVLP